MFLLQFVQFLLSKCCPIFIQRFVENEEIEISGWIKSYAEEEKKCGSGKLLRKKLGVIEQASRG